MNGKWRMKFLFTYTNTVVFWNLVKHADLILKRHDQNRAYAGYILFCLSLISI
jgi:hypothetical protein